MKTPKISIISGGAGFIGVNLIPALFKENRLLFIIDNMTKGSASFVRSIKSINQDYVKIFNIDCTDTSSLEYVFDEANKLGTIDEVWHLAANSDIPAGVLDLKIDLKDTFLSTVELLNVMRQFKVDVFNFASSSAVYGDLGDTPLHEDIGPLLPISNYGAMKLASEAAISAASESFLRRVNLFRFPNVVGVPATHGVIFDFIHKLSSDPTILNVLGDGTQQKSYLHVSDLVSAMLHIRDGNRGNKLELVNIGPIDLGISVSWIAEQVVSHVSPKANIIYGSGNKGWIGDVPRFNYSTSRLQSYGWNPKLGSADAVKRAIVEIASQFID